MVSRHTAFSCLIFLLLAPPVWSNCGIARFTDLAKLNDIREEFSDYSLEYRLQKAAVEQKKDNERRERNTPPIELSVLLSGTQVSDQFSESAEARFTYDINFALKFLNRTRSFLLEENYEKRLKNIDLEERIEYLKKTLSWLYSNELYKMYEKRLEILVEREAYLKEKQQQGLSVASEVSRAKLEIISLENKILAVKSRQEILVLEFENVNLSVLKNLKISWSPAIRALSCADRSYEITLAQDNVKYFRVQKNIDRVSGTVSSSFFASQDLYDSNSEPTVGVTLNITLLSPKTRGTTIRATSEKLDQSMRDLHLASYRLEKLYREQQKVEALIVANLEAVDTEIEERNRILGELSVRAALGQTVFDQKSTTLLELSGMQEVRMQRVFDLYTGWLQFISVRGLED